jgi:hypothetical protein
MRRNCAIAKIAKPGMALQHGGRKSGARRGCQFEDGTKTGRLVLFEHPLQKKFPQEAGKIRQNPTKPGKFCQGFFTRERNVAAGTRAVMG